MTEDITHREISELIVRKKLGSYLSSAATVQKCVALCGKYKQEPSRFLDSLEAFILNTNEDSLTLEMIGSFEQALMKERQTTKSSGILKELNTPKKISEGLTLGKRSSTTYQTPHQGRSVKAMPNSSQQTIASQSESGQLSQLHPGSASGHSKPIQAALLHSESKTPAGTISYAQRSGSGQSVLNYNQSLEERGSFIPSANSGNGGVGARCKLVCSDEDHSNVTQRFRFMFTTLDERARALDKHLLRLQSRMCELIKIEEDDLQPVGIPSQELVWMCGRICCEAAEGRINKSSVVLEGSRRDSSGRRVPLNLTEVPSYSLFPGQIVLVQGINSSGREITAKQIVEGVALPRLKSSATQLLEYQHSKYYQGGAPLHVVTAAGPFTTEDSLSYQPLQDLLIKILESKPDVVVLLGPFVSIEQSLLSSGDVQLEDNVEEGEAADMDTDAGTEKQKRLHHASYEMVFVEKVVRDCLGQMFNSEEDFGSLPSKFVLIPSLKDAHHEFVFPQPPFGDRDRVETKFFTEPLGVLDIPFSHEGDKNRRVYLLSNPCMFRVNEVLFAACSNDALFSLSSDSASHNLRENRLTRLASHLLMQQSFAPQFPVASGDSRDSAQYDMRHARHWEWKVQPDVLLVPSRLQPLCKEICGTLVVNSGHLARGTTGGTFANIHIHPHTEAQLRETSIQMRSKNQPDDVLHDVNSRTRVSIVRI